MASNLNNYNHSKNEVYFKKVLFTSATTEFDNCNQNIARKQRQKQQQHPFIIHVNFPT